MKSLIISILIFFSLFTLGLNGQVAINKDGSEPAPNAILHVKGSGGNHFFIHDLSGNVGIGTIYPQQKLHVVGQIKLAGIGNGSASDSLLVWSPVDSILKVISPARLNLFSTPFTTIGNVTSNAPGDLANDDFVFGGDALDYSGYQSRMFFDKSKGAFRAGSSNGNKWNTNLVGMYSTAFGIGSEASGDYSFASGSATTASGESATSMGRNATATGVASTSMGSYSIASGDQSTAIGYYSEAVGNSSVSIGNNSEAIGHHSISLGFSSVAMGDTSIALGRSTVANGVNSFATGYSSTANGVASVTAGYNNTAEGDYSFAGGNTNTAEGTSSSAFGQNNMASGEGSVVFGKTNTSSGDYSLTVGLDNESSGSGSFSTGNQNTASGDYSFVAGQYSAASGKAATAMGQGVTAPSPYEVAIGSYNSVYTPESTTNWNGLDRIFSIGNGTSTNRNDAMVVLKNGKVGINTSTPSAKLTVIGNENDGTVGALEIGTSGSAERLFFDGDEIDSATPLFLNANSKQAVAIGSHDIASGYMLSVGGKMIATEVLVQLETAWPDYVFGKDYLLKPLPELEEFIKKNKHLPGIPKAEEVEKSGLELGAMEIKLMEKIEELTLHFIDLDKRVQALESSQKPSNDE